jgi:hypothetical protein
MNARLKYIALMLKGNAKVMKEEKKRDMNEVSRINCPKIFIHSIYITPNILKCSGDYSFLL